MDTVGRIVNITQNFLNRKLQVTFEIDTSPVEELNSLAGIDLNVTAKKFRAKRSLDANAYFHVLVGKIADKLGVSKTKVKNILIGRYGQQDFLEEGNPIIIKTNLDVDKMLEQEFLHCVPCGNKFENGSEVIFYKVFRGSHTYDSKEMSILIDGAVSEAKEMGIETMSPDELKRMIERWKSA